MGENKLAVKNSLAAGSKILRTTKVLLIAINAKFTHTNLAVRSVKAYAERHLTNKHSFDISYKEYTINQSTKDIMADIYQQDTNIIIFSCYIWNINMVLEISKNLKKVRHEQTIVLAGPEVSYDYKILLEQHNWIDSVIAGEGERAFIEMLADYQSSLGLIKLSYSSTLLTPTELISAYSNYQPEKLKVEFANRTLYYETSRGCPYSCAYCLSGVEAGVRFFPLEIVYADLEMFIVAEIKQVKFVDRTFNCNPDRARSIFKWILEMSEKAIIKTNFHFEMAGDLIDAATIDILASAPEGLFQFEIGVQTTNPATVKAIQRQNDWPLISKSVTALKKHANLHIHLDLIAGLPHEDMAAFAKSFDDVYQLRPEMLQLGFLKLLRGSQLREDANKYGIVYNELAPYEVLQTADLSYADLIKLHEIEHIVEHYYNSRQFINTVEWLHSLQNYSLYGYQLYEKMAIFLKQTDFYERAHSQQAIFGFIYEYIKNLATIGQQQIAVAQDLLRFDFLLLGAHAKLPKFLQNSGIENLMQKQQRQVNWQEVKRKFFYNQTIIEKYAPHLENNNMRERNKVMHLDVFQHNILETADLQGKYEQGNTFVLFVYSQDRLAFNKAKCYNVTNYFNDIL